MKYDNINRIFDCESTLTDTQVLEFCKNGFLILEGVVDDDINQRTCDYLDGKIPAEPSYVPEGLTHEDLERIRNSHEPSTIFLEDWFVEHVVLNPQVTGVVRSLLGRNVGLPVLMSLHRAECPSPAQGWHHDADHAFGPEVRFIQAFYYPQDTPLEMGPTEIVPGSHIRPTHRDAGDRGLSTTAPAGSFVVHFFQILHRRGEATGKGVRHMLKYNYWRTVPPQRDWIVEPNFDFHTADYGSHGVARYIAHMFHWLCGKADEFRIIGGQAWPYSGSSMNQIGKTYGFGEPEGFIPNWRHNNADNYATPS